MPYIKQADRVRLVHDKPRTVGELNYLITRLCLEYLDNAKPETYSIINSVIGALECAKLELYRRVAVPYENIKRNENGEVYP
jgi:hypothetical protein